MSSLSTLGGTFRTNVGAPPMTKDASLYQCRLLDATAIRTISYLLVPGWGMWLQLTGDYKENEADPILSVHTLDELSGYEFEQSLAASKNKPGQLA